MAKGYNTFRYVGSRYYAVGIQTGNNPAVTTNYQTEHLYALPFISGREGTLDRIGLIADNAATPAASGHYAVLGFYNIINASIPFPGSLRFDAGSIATASANLRAITITESLQAGAMYWAVVALSSGGVPNLRPVPTRGCPSFPMGWLASQGVNSSLAFQGAAIVRSVVGSFQTGQLPAVFPISGSQFVQANVAGTGVACPQVVVRWGT